MPVLPDPKFILSIKNLSLAARYMVDPFLSGINKSRVKGQGQEFSQYRSYQPGDDLQVDGLENVCQVRQVLCTGI